jgi:regulatory protein
MKNKPGKKIEYDEGLELLRQYCSYRARCHKEVRTKLIDLKIYGDDLEKIMASLVEEDFLNEERYAQAFVRGKYRINKWGKMKILQNLKRNNISPYIIKKALAEIDVDEYRTTLRNLLTEKLFHVKEKNKARRYQKLNRYALQKGYEYSLVKELIEELIN